MWKAGRRGVMKRTSLWETNDKEVNVVKTVKDNAFKVLDVVTGQFESSASRDLKRPFRTNGAIVVLSNGMPWER